MKKILFLFLVIIILVLGFLGYRNSSIGGIISRLAKNQELLSGRLTYRIYLWGILPIGEATLYPAREIDYQSRKAYHLQAEAKSLKFLSGFFSASAVLESYIDTQEFLPFVFRQELVISGKENEIKQIDYDQKEEVMIIEGIRRKIVYPTYDPLSAIFALRRFDFDKEKSVQININTNQKNYILEAVSKIRQLEVNKQNHQIVLVESEIKRRDKSPRHRSSVYITLLKDRENLPLLIKVSASGFSMLARLVAEEN